MCLCVRLYVYVCMSVFVYFFWCILTGIPSGKSNLRKGKKNANVYADSQAFIAIICQPSTVVIAF